jgi:hypothetical protein
VRPATQTARKVQGLFVLCVGNRVDPARAMLEYRANSTHTHIELMRGCLALE